MSFKQRPCYKCNKVVSFDIPFDTEEFTGFKALCECGHEMVTFTPKDPETRKLLQEGAKELLEDLKKEKYGTLQ